MTQPNLLVIVTHDTGRHLGCYGIPTVHTEVLDGLAGDGVRLTNLFAPSPVCSPSRGSLLTGQYPQHNGLIGLAAMMWNWELTNPRVHLSHVLRSAGYETLLFGQQHETADIGTLGYERVEAYLGPNEIGIVEAAERRHAEGVAEAVAAFLRAPREAKRPFYAQVGFHETHTPYTFGATAPDDSLGVHRPAYAQTDEQAWQHYRANLGAPAGQQAADRDAVLREDLAGLQGSLRRVDRAVGAILAALRAGGWERDTIVVFTTDHGPALPRAKWTLFDPGVAVAMIVRWPGGGIVGGRRCEWLLSHVDIVPTLGELMGVTLPPSLDGMSFAGGLRAETGGRGPRSDLGLIYIHGNLWGWRTERFKLLRNFNEGYEPGYRDHRDARQQRRVLLYDLQNDPLELRDVADDPRYGAVLAELHDGFWRWLERVDDPILRGPVPTPYFRRAMEDYRRWKAR